nr:hypothetical protein GCM10010200_069170 [Actinomadura rugatobispora]
MEAAFLGTGDASGNSGRCDHTGGALRAVSDTGRTRARTRIRTPDRSGDTVRAGTLMERSRGADLLVREDRFQRPRGAVPPEPPPPGGRGAPAAPPPERAHPMTPAMPGRENIGHERAHGGMVVALGPRPPGTRRKPRCFSSQFDKSW